MLAFLVGEILILLAIVFLDTHAGIFLREDTDQNHEKAKSQIKQRNLQGIRKGVNDRSSWNPDHPGGHRKNQNHIKKFRPGFITLPLLD